MSSIMEQVEALLERYDSDIRFECASACAWEGQLRLTLTDPEGAPSRSIAFYSAGGSGPEEVAAALLADCGAWLRESGVEPMPVPAWMREDEP
jgi:hypothetical protein